MRQSCSSLPSSLCLTPFHPEFTMGQHSRQHPKGGLDMVQLSCYSMETEVAFSNISILLAEGHSAFLSMEVLALNNSALVSLNSFIVLNLYRSLRFRYSSRYLKYIEPLNAFKLKYIQRWHIFKQICLPSHCPQRCYMVISESTEEVHPGAHALQPAQTVLETSAGYHASLVSSGIFLPFIIFEQNFTPNQTDSNTVTGI